MKHTENFTLCYVVWKLIGTAHKTPTYRCKFVKLLVILSKFVLRYFIHKWHDNWNEVCLSQWSYFKCGILCKFCQNTCHSQAFSRSWTSYVSYHCKECVHIMRAMLKCMKGIVEVIITLWTVWNAWKGDENCPHIETSLN